MNRLVLAVTGASGAIYAQRLLQELVRADVQVELVVSPNGVRLLADELDIKPFTPEALAAGPVPNVTLHPYRDTGAAIASGSYRTAGMVICPCSSNTLADVAAGTGANLVARAAQVTLKEARRLVLVPREMPLSQIEIANMLRISQAGGVICPASPGFYLRPDNVMALVDFVVGRILDLLDVPHDLDVRWKPGSTDNARSHEG
jgi:4-hydroxy-3-polyprenylbenzoate decarboxylase